MSKPLNAKLRQLWVDVHLWIGVALSVAFIPLALSGALLVWHDPLERMIHADRFDVSASAPALEPEAYVSAAREAFGDRAVPAQVRFAEEPGQPVVVTGQMDAPPVNGRPQQLTAWLDPATAEVKDVANTRQAFFSVMHRLHGTLLIPEIGRKTVGWLGWAMTASCLTGLWIWWPRNGAFLNGLRWKRTPMVFDNLHHLVGFWVLVPLLVLSLTGVYISFPQTSRAVFGVEQAAPQARGPAAGGRGAASGAPLEAPSLDANAAVATARAHAPQGEVAQITLPTEGRDPVWRVQFRGEAAPVTISVSDANGAATPDRAGAGPGRGVQDPLSRWMRNIHYGTDTGLLWQILIFFGGAAPVLLSVTGIVMWIRRTRRQAALRRLRAAPAE